MKIEAKERVEEAEMKRDGVKVVKDVVGVSENVLKTKEEEIGILKKIIAKMHA